MKRLVPLIIILILVAIAVSFALAQQGDLALDRYTFAGSSGTSSRGDYTLRGTAGQAEAGPVMSAERFTVNGGFWSGLHLPSPDSDQTIYLPLVVK